MKNYLISCLAVAALSFASGASAQALYTTVTPPITWTTSAGAAYYKAAANDVSFANGVRGASGVINVGGTSVKMGAAYRFAANAPRVAASFAYLNPALMLLGTAATAYAYYKTGGFEVIDGVWKKKEVVPGCINGVCYEYQDPVTGAWGLTFQQAIASWLAEKNKEPDWAYTATSQNEAAGTWNLHGVLPAWNLTSNLQQQPSRRVVVHDDGTAEFVPVTRTEFENDMSQLPLPEGVPQQLPVPLPVEVPILNPSPVNPVNPLAVPLPQPLDVPLGPPVVKPGSDPAKWETPFQRITPANDPNAPWRVTTEPKVHESANPDGLPSTPTATPSDSTPFEMPCGVAGKPACTVKVDEAGMPSNVPSTEHSPLAESYKTTMDENRETISGNADKGFLSGWSVLFSAPALHSCSPIVLPNGMGGQSMGSIDPCGVVDGVRQVMGYLWALGGLWLCLGMVKRTF